MKNFDLDAWLMGASEEEIEDLELMLGVYGKGRR